MKKTLFLILLLSSIRFMNAQEVLLDETPSEYKFYKEKIPKFGPNGKFYANFYTTIRFYTPALYGEQIDIKYFRAKDLELGYNLKLRITNWLATGTQAYYNITNLPNNSVLSYVGNVYFTPWEIKDSKFVLNNVGLAPYLRINIGKRGNTVGNYIDFIGWAEYNDLKRSVIKFSSDDAYQKIVTKGSNYFNNFNYGISLRIGMKWIALEAKYRLSDLTQLSALYPFPKFSVGLQFSQVK